MLFVALCVFSPASPVCAKALQANPSMRLNGVQLPIRAGLTCEFCGCADAPGLESRQWRPVWRVPTDGSCSSAFEAIPPSSLVVRCLGGPGMSPFAAKGHASIICSFKGSLCFERSEACCLCHRRRGKRQQSPRQSSSTGIRMSLLPTSHCSRMRASIPSGWASGTGSWRTRRCSIAWAHPLVQLSHGGTDCRPDMAAHLTRLHLVQWSLDPSWKSTCARLRELLLFAMYQLQLRDWNWTKSDGLTPQRISRMSSLPTDRLSATGRGCTVR